MLKVNKVKWMAIGNVGLLSAILAITSGSLASAQQDQTAAPVPTVLSDWSMQVWDAAKADDLARVNVLLESVPQGESPALLALKKSIQQRDNHLV